MPGHREAKKDAANSEMRRRAVSMQRPADVRMGEPARNRDRAAQKCGETRGTETSKYPEERKIRMIP